MDIADDLDIAELGREVPRCRAAQGERCRSADATVATARRRDRDDGQRKREHDGVPAAVPAPLVDRSANEHAAVEHAERPRIGALDGLRAVAVLAVVAYHLWPDRLPGGFLGVDLFMVLSGYLITGLLVEEHRRRGGVHLGAFWMRRFRRLVPALLALLTGVALWMRFVGSAALVPTVRRQGIASLLYVGNWRLVADGTSYAALSGPTSPLLHLWSLAIEEQFYLVWPLVVVGVMAMSQGRRRPLVLVASAGAVMSGLLMAVWFEPGHDPLRLYFGTDTRAQSFLIGALALLTTRRSWLHRFGLPAFVLIVAAFVVGDSNRVLYQGGFALFAMVAATAVVAVTGPGPLARLLDREPLRLIGRVSYGIYLWHWPVIVLITADTVPVSGVALLAMRLTLIAALTAASWLLIERPYRAVPTRRALGFAAAGIAVTALCLVTLPRRQVIAYASVDVNTIPTPLVQRAETPAATPVAKTVMIVGDSGMYDATPALTAGFSAVGSDVIATAFAGEAVTRPPGLRDSWAATVDQYRPDLVVVMLGAWDYDFVAANGDAAYVAQIDATLAVLTSHGARVAWLSVLPGDAVVPGKRVPATELDRFFAALPARYPGVVDYVDIGRALDPSNGGLLRKPDGWHLCPDGAAAVARVVLSHAGVTDTSWLSGSWRADQRYDDPPGGCPQ